MPLLPHRLLLLPLMPLLLQPPLLLLLPLLLLPLTQQLLLQQLLPLTLPRSPDGFTGLTPRYKKTASGRFFCGRTIPGRPR